MMATTTELQSASSLKPFEMFSWDLWGYLRLNRDSLDSGRWTERIQLRMENELCFVVEPLKLEIARLDRELRKTRTKLATAKATNKELRKAAKDAS
jgi:hypothetical protein